MLHFAYGSNMDRPRMLRRCPNVAALGPARLDHWRFLITRDGYASVVPSPGGVVHGVLWRLSPRDLAAVNAYESLDSGLYRRRMLRVRQDRCVQALTYVGRERGVGRPKPGYLELVLEAARAWQLPARYVEEIAGWLPGRGRAIRAVDIGEVA